MDEEKRPVGRPPHVPTKQNQEIAEGLAGYGIPHEKIAAILRIDHKTLHRHYQDQLDHGAAVVEAKLISNLLRIANGSDGTALKAIIFSLQCRFGWSPYAPPPPEAIAAHPLGKKALLELEAETAHERSSWGDLLQ